MSQPDILDELSNIDLSKYKGVMQAVVIVIVLCFTVYTSVFTVDPEEKAVVLKFGKEDRIVGQGLHFKLPFFMEQEYKVPVQRQLKLEFGFRTAGNETRQQYAQTQYSGDGPQNLYISVSDTVVCQRSHPYTQKWMTRRR